MLLSKEKEDFVLLKSKLHNYLMSLWTIMAELFHKAPIWQSIKNINLYKLPITSTYRTLEPPISRLNPELLNPQEPDTKI